MSKRISLSLEPWGGKRRELSFEVGSLVCAGFAGRDTAKVRKHIEELRSFGVEPPARIPSFYRLAPYILTTDAENNSIEVKGRETSGEAEWIGLLSDELYVTIGSDHTDRKLEGQDIGLSKQICQKVISAKVWRYSDLQDHWDRLKITCWTLPRKNESLYQVGEAKDILSPEDLIHKSKVRRGAVLFSGTYPTEAGKVVFADRYEMKLEDPVLKRSISLSYGVIPLGDE